MNRWAISDPIGASLREQSPGHGSGTEPIPVGERGEYSAPQNAPAPGGSSRREKED